MSNPRILMIAPLCYPPNNPEAFVNANLAKAFIDAEWQLSVLTDSDEEQCRWYPSATDAWGGLVHRVRTYAKRGESVSHRVSTICQNFVKSGHLIGGGRWALPAAEKAIAEVKNNSFDVILSRALPPMAHHIALIVAKKTGIPWIANWNDPVPWKKFPVQFSGCKGRNASLGFWETRFYNDVARHADWHTFPCERLRKYVTGYLPKGTYEKSSVIPHIALSNSSQTVKRGQKFTVMHAGSLMSPRSPDVFLKGVKLFRERNGSIDDFTVVFIVDRPDDVRNAATVHGVEDVVTIESSRPYSEMPTILATADVLIIVEAQVDEGIFLPSKFVDYVRSGRPILAISPQIGTLADILNKDGGGIAVDGRQTNEVADALQNMYVCWLNGTLDEKYGSQKLYPHYSSEKVLKDYKEIISRIGNKS